MRRRHRSAGVGLLFALCCALLLAVPAVAQYRDAGSDLDVLPNRKEQLEKAMKDAPWRFGGARITPWIGLRDVNYVRELDSTGKQRPGDLTITGGAGLKAYLPLGTHAIAAAHAMPEYAWWQREKDRNAVVGHYGLGIFGWGNRIQGEVTARRVEEVRFLSPDVLVRAPVRGDEAAASAQVRVLGSIALFGSGTADRIRVTSTQGLTVGDPALLLDRDSNTVRGGLRYLLRGDRGYLGGGVLSERTTFQDADAIRSNKGTSWYSEALVHGNHADVNLQYNQRDLEADGSTFPGYKAGNGRATLLLHPGWRMQYQVYGFRELRYSALAVTSFLEEERGGAALAFALGKGRLQLFYERGNDNYFGLDQRSESVTARGGWIDVSVRSLQLRVGGRQTTFTPTLGPTREVREILGGLSLTLGQPGEW